MRLSSSLARFAAAGLGTILMVSTGVAQEAAEQASYEEAVTHGEPMMHAFTSSEDLEYADLDVPGFDPGMKIAVIHGDPGAEEGDYTIRLSFPDAYRFPPHYHPVPEHLTVISGTFLLARGETADETKLERFAPGDFLYIPPQDPHFGGVEGETVIQLHGPAPFKIMLVEAVE